MNSVHFNLTPRTIADQLRRRLLALDYPAFARCACVLLEAIGYEDARLAGRREWKGYNRPGGGGYDLEASLPGGLAPRRVIAQIKQFDQLAVHQRSVDELRGACLRAQAAEALLVTTSAFSEVVRKHASSPGTAGVSVAPVHLIDGKELLGLLIRHRLGVRERVRGGTRRLGNNLLELDEAFFGSGTAFVTLAAVTLAASDDEAAPGMGSMPARRGSTPPTWKVTVRISSGPRSRAQNGKRRKEDAGREGTDTEKSDTEGGS